MTSPPDAGKSTLDARVEGPRPLNARVHGPIAHDDTLAPQGRDARLVDLLDPLLGPTRLGHHVLLEKLGQGGMGVVFAAFDTKLDRKVAIKVLRAPDGEQSRARMIREAKAMARVSHPNVVQVYEIGEHDQLTFLVLEFVDGLTLAAWLAERPRTRREILTTFIAAGRGLVAAHQKGLVHRDFKPKSRFPSQTPPFPPSGQVLANRGVLGRGPWRVMPLDAADLATDWQRARASARPRRRHDVRSKSPKTAPHPHSQPQSHATRA